MGNVMASSAAPPAPPTPAEDKATKPVLENPGSMDELHKACKDVFPVNFEGAKIMVNKGLSNHFQISTHAQHELGDSVWV